jgi:hypothetical protein
MRIKGIAAAAAITCMLLPATAAAKTATFAGTLDDGGKIGLDVKVNKKGKVKKLLQARGTELRLDCEQSGSYDNAYAAFDGPIKIANNGEFEGRFEQPQYGNVSIIDGDFKRKKVSGTFVFDYHFLEDTTTDPPLPEEDCTTGVVGFEAKKKADDATQPFPPQRASAR